MRRTDAEQVIIGLVKEPLALRLLQEYPGCRRFDWKFA